MADKESQLVGAQTDKTADSTDARKGSVKKGVETSKFSNYGTAFRAKLIGYEDVPEARGDEMCQKALTSLKQAVVAAKEHKQKIAFKMTLENLEIVDLTTSEILHQHPINKVSFIAKDASDGRAFGYVVGKGDGKFQFFGIKTEKAAEQVVLTLRDLFTEVFNLKKQAKEKEAEQASAPAATAATAADDGSRKADSVDASTAPTSALPAAAAGGAAVAVPGPATAAAPPAEPKKSAVASLIDLDIDWGIGSSQPATQANAAFPNSAWGGPASPMTQMGFGTTPPLGQMGLGGSMSAQNDPFVVAPTVSRQLGSPPAQQHQLQQQPPSQSTPYSLQGFGGQPQQQQQQMLFGQQQQQPLPLGQPQQPSLFGQQQPPPFGQQQPSLFGQQQPSPFGQQQPSSFGQQQQQAFGQQQPTTAPAFGQQMPTMAYGQQQPSTFSQLPLLGQPSSQFASVPSQPQVNAAGQMQWPQPSQSSMAAGAFGMAPTAAGNLPPSQQPFFAQGPAQPAMAAQVGQPQGPYGVMPAQFTPQQQQQQQSLFFQQQQQPGPGGIQQAFGGQQAGAVVNPFAAQQQQQPANNPFGAAPPGGSAQAGMLPRPAPRANQPPQQQQPGWGGSGPVPPPRSAADAFAELDLLRNSAGATAQAPQAGAGNNPNGSFW